MTNLLVFRCALCFVASAPQISQCHLANSARGGAGKRSHELACSHGCFPAIFSVYIAHHEGRSGLPLQSALTLFNCTRCSGVGEWGQLNRIPTNDPWLANNALLQSSISGSIKILSPCFLYSCLWLPRSMEIRVIEMQRDSDIPPDVTKENTILSHRGEDGGRGKK